MSEYQCEVEGCTKKVTHQVGEWFYCDEHYGLLTAKAIAVFGNDERKWKPLYDTDLEPLLKRIEALEKNIETINNLPFELIRRLEDGEVKIEQLEQKIGIWDWNIFERIDQLKQKLEKLDWDVENRTCNALLSHMNEKGRPDEHGLNKIRERIEQIEHQLFAMSGDPYIIRDHAEEIPKLWKEIEELTDEVDNNFELISQNREVLQDIKNDLFKFEERIYVNGIIPRPSSSGEKEVNLEASSSLVDSIEGSSPSARNGQDLANSKPDQHYTVKDCKYRKHRFCSINITDEICGYICDHFKPKESEAKKNRQGYMCKNFDRNSSACFGSYMCDECDRFEPKKESDAEKPLTPATWKITGENMWRTAAEKGIQLGNIQSILEDCYKTLQKWNYFDDKILVAKDAIKFIFKILREEGFLGVIEDLKNIYNLEEV